MGRKLTEFGKELAKFRVDQDLKQFQMADLLGCSPTYLSNIEHGIKGLSKGLMPRIEKLFTDRGADTTKILKLAPYAFTFIRIDVRDQPDYVMECASRFAAAIENNQLTKEKARKIIEILERSNVKSR